jgi:hypothetical protein
MCGLLRRLLIARLVEYARRESERTDHHRVPAGEDFRVEQRLLSLVAYGLELLPHLVDARAVLLVCAGSARKRMFLSGGEPGRHGADQQN